MRAGSTVDCEGQCDLIHDMPTVSCTPFLGTGTSVKDISPAQLGQRSKRSNTPGKDHTKSCCKCFPSFPLDTGHMFSLGLQAIFRLSLKKYFFFFYFIVNVFFKCFLYLATYYFYAWVKMHTKKNVFVKVLTSILLCI